MASVFTRSGRFFHPVTLSAATLTVASTLYYASSRPHLLDSPNNAPRPLLSFPSTMLFSKQLTVQNVEQINHDTKRITFSLPGGSSEVSGVAPGSAILTQTHPNNSFFPVLRPYTPIQPPSSRGIVQLLVKQYPSGRASTHLHSLTPGQTLTVRGPLPGYSFTPSSSPQNLLFIAGGAGITPLYSLANGILRSEDDQTKIHLVWGVNGVRDIVLKDELEGLEKEFPGRLKVTYVVSSGLPQDQVGEKVKRGYVNAGILKEVMNECSKEGRFGDDKGKKVFLCGPPKMEEAVAGKSGVLQALGVEKKGIHKF